MVLIFTVQPRSLFEYACISGGGGFEFAGSYLLTVKVVDNSFAGKRKGQLQTIWRLLNIGDFQISIQNLHLFVHGNNGIQGTAVGGNFNGEFTRGLFYRGVE